MTAIDSLCNALREKNVCHETGRSDDGRVYVALSFSGDTYSDRRLLVTFDSEEMRSVSIRCEDICRFSADKYLVMLQTVNYLNNAYRWLTFGIISERQVFARLDMEFEPDKVALFLLTWMHGFAEVLDAAYPYIMKAIYTRG